jgi:hypothetical protein
VYFVIPIFLLDLEMILGFFIDMLQLHVINLIWHYHPFMLFKLFVTGMSGIWGIFTNTAHITTTSCKLSCGW